MQSTDLLLGTPPLDLISCSSLFLDFDGTLVELVDRPDRVRADPELVALLRRLGDALPGRVAIVSGRSIEQLDGMLGEAAHAVALAGSHGAEFRTKDGAAQGMVPPVLPRIAADMDDFAASRPGVLVERKTLGVGLHYRAAPEHEAEALALAGRLAREHGLYLQPGKMMAEVRADGDKGRAVTALTASAAMAGTVPLVFGDDVTDEDGFRAAATLGGAGVLVGEARETAATYALRDVTAVRRWLERALERPR